MTIKIRVYDHDLHRWLRANEVRIDVTGQVWYNHAAGNVFDDWQPLHPNAEWLEVVSVTIINNGTITNIKNQQSRIRQNKP